MSETPDRTAPLRRVLPLALELDRALDGRCGGDLQGFVDALTVAPTPQATPLPSLIVEDDPDDAFLLLRALSFAASRGDVRIVDSVVDARRLLQSPRFKPVLIVLAVSPRVRDIGPFFDWVRGQERLRKIPILALLGAVPPSVELRRLLDARGVYWMVKPTEHERLATVLQKLLTEASDFKST